MEQPACNGGSVAAEPWIENGAVVCSPCRTIYPVIDGLPVMLPYRTPEADELIRRCRGLPPSVSGFAFPAGTPPPGEEFVQRSFSTEWTEYDYDGVMWDLSYEDHEARFLAECGERALEHARGGLFVEIGCGLGMSTFVGQKHVGGDAIGVDLGQAAARAARHFKSNPRMHFVRGSAFAVPIRNGSASLVYSHGVLHHTYSTEQAVKRVARLCRPGGVLYVWLYGPESQKGSPLRRAAWAAEAALRPWMARHHGRTLPELGLRTFALGYLAVNRYHRVMDRTVQPYNFRRALHAARDRFTPLFAHRHAFDEVAAWFKAIGFDDVEQVDWRTMPTANQPNYRRNTGVRGYLMPRELAL